MKQKRATARFQKAMGRALPLLGLAVMTSLASLSLGCSPQNQNGQVSGNGTVITQGKDIQKQARRAAEESQLRSWVETDPTERDKWILSKEAPIYGIMDVEHNVLAWFDGQSNLTIAPTYEDARSLVEKGQVSQIGNLARRYAGYDSATVKALRDETTKVVGCTQPAYCDAMVILIRGVQRDPAAGPVDPGIGEEQAADLSQFKKGTLDSLNLKR